MASRCWFGTGEVKLQLLVNQCRESTSVLRASRLSRTFHCATSSLPSELLIHVQYTEHFAA